MKDNLRYDYIYSQFFLFIPVPGLAALRGSVKAAGLGREEGPAMVSTAAEPGQTQHKNQVL